MAVGLAKEATAQEYILPGVPGIFSTLKLVRRHSGRGKHQVLERPPTAERLEESVIEQKWVFAGVNYCQLKQTACN